jgi:PhnB protein
MPSSLNPYLNFRGNAREAMEFYKTVFGGELEMQTFEEYYASQDPREDHKIMHAMLTTDNGIVIMASDMPNNMKNRTGLAAHLGMLARSHTGTNISMLLSGDNVAELTAYYEKLSAGGIIGMPLEKAPWGDTFGMFTDKFGVSWLVNISNQKE